MSTQPFKHKCCKSCYERKAGKIVPPHSPLTSDPVDCKAHPSHTCSKEGHACLRNIVSFKKLPGRNTFRRMGRAFLFAVRSVMPGFGLKNLSRGKDDITTALEKQHTRSPEHNQKFGCVKCGRCMEGPSMLTSDTGQAYEMIDPKTIESSFEDIFNAVKPPPRRRIPPSPLSTV